VKLLRGLSNGLGYALTLAGTAAAGVGSTAGETGSGASGLTPREEAALRRVRALADLLDEAVTVPGTNYRVGLDPILGVLPVGGDAVAAVLSLYPIVEGHRLDVPTSTLVTMLFVVAIDAAVGSIPVLGTLFDAVWKANQRNLRTLERHVEAA